MVNWFGVGSTMKVGVETLMTRAFQPFCLLGSMVQTVLKLVICFDN